MTKVIVNHSGVCGEHSWTKDVETELPEEVIAAIGEDSVERLAKSKKKVEEDPGEEIKSKDQKPAFDKMLTKEDVLGK